MFQNIFNTTVVRLDEEANDLIDALVVGFQYYSGAIRCVTFTIHWPEHGILFNTTVVRLDEMQRI